MYRIAFSRKAEKSLGKIPQNYQLKLKEKIVSLAQSPRQPGVVKVYGASKANRRLRVGDYRILFKIDDEIKTVIIAEIKRRTTTTYRR